MVFFSLFFHLFQCQFWEADQNGHMQSHLHFCISFPCVAPFLAAGQEVTGAQPTSFLLLWIAWWRSWLCVSSLEDAQKRWQILPLCCIRWLMGLASFGSHHMGLELAIYRFAREYMLRQLSASLIEDNWSASAWAQQSARDVSSYLWWLNSSSKTIHYGKSESLLPHLTSWINRVQYQPFTIGSCTLWSPAALIQPMNRIHQQLFMQIWSTPGLQPPT